MKQHTQTPLAPPRGDRIKGNKMELEIKIGGIYYKLEIDHEEGYVTNVFSVAVWNGEKYQRLPLNREELKEFYKRYEEELSEEFQEQEKDKFLAYMEDKGEDLWETEL